MYTVDVYKFTEKLLRDTILIKRFIEPRFIYELYIQTFTIFIEFSSFLPVPHFNNHAFNVFIFLYLKLNLFSMYVNMLQTIMYYT